MNPKLRGMMAVGLLSCLMVACESSDPVGTVVDSGATGGMGGAGGAVGGEGGSGGNVVVEPDAGPDAAVDPCNGVPVRHLCLDADGDLHGDPENAQDTCEAPDGNVEACDDCDDTRPEAYPEAAELCNTLDDNCDGTVDEGIAVDEVCTSGVGACEAAGVSVCLPTGELGCDATPGTPGTETCNEIDDDCNGVVDDTGASEVCNGLDDNCDGAVDEGLGVGEACTVGVGACRGEGVNGCALNGQVACDAVAGNPVAEICDSLDNDCDGNVDNTPEGCDCVDASQVACGSDVGECSPGVQTCVGGRLGPCEGATEATPETCDGADDDCDGTVDNRVGEICECLDGATQNCGSDIGECVAGTQTCVDGAWDACTGTSPVAEMCNGLDDDCNDVVDDRAGDACECLDGVQRECGTDIGECIAGTESCVNGHWGTCSATGPAAETCDGLDNDCNGVDDDRANDVCECITGTAVPCGNDVGACVFGSAACVDGHVGECVGGVGPADELYDNEDNDCDGALDNVVCEPLSTDFPAGDSFQGCISQDGTFHAFFPDSVSSIARTQAFDQIGELLWRAANPGAQAFADARQIYAVAEGIDSRLQRRFDSHFESSVPAGTNCRTAGVPAQFPDYCVGPGKLSPIITAAFDAGMAGQDPTLNAAKLEAALLWFFYTSVYKESVTCGTAIADCDSSHAYYTAATPRDAPAGMGKYVNDIDAYAHQRVYEGTLGTHCWRELDNGAAAANNELKALALGQLDLALDYAGARILFTRLHRWENAVGDAKVAEWAFVQIWGQAMDRAIRVRDAAQADIVAGMLTGDGTGVDPAAIEDIVFPLIPCP